MIINMVGGGAALNFKVVPGLTQPGTSSENTIWVKTEKIGVWYFSATQPEGMQEWDVWFLTGTESDVEFNALKKNGIQVYPLSAKQCINGAWVDKVAKIWQGGEWSSLVTAPTDGLIAEYTFEEFSGNAITDTSPNGYNLTATNVTQGNGIVGKSAHFAGNGVAKANSRIIPDGMSGFAGLTISFWLKTQKSSAFRSIMGTNNTHTGLYMYIYDNSNILETTTGVSNGNVRIDDSKITDGQWHHVCFVFNYSTNKVRALLDGVQKDEGSCSKFTASGSNFTVGNHPTASNYEQLTGSLDQLRIYNRALSDSEVATLWNGGVGC